MNICRITLELLIGKQNLYFFFIIIIIVPIFQNPYYIHFLFFFLKTC